MKIEDKFELMSLHRCLFESKFNPHPNDRDIAGSPMAAKLANAVVDELEIVDGPQWREWRIAENHQERIKELISALKRRDLSSIDSTEQEQFVTDALAPLKAEKGTIGHICREVFGA